MNWQRVSKSHPCPVCQKTHWCMIAPKGDVVLCMRTTSSKPHPLKGGEVGYFHSTGAVPRSPTTLVERRPDPVINVGKMMAQWQAETTGPMLKTLSDDLGVSPAALERLGFAWAKQHTAWGIPMRDGYGNYVGIRLRANNGQKWAVKGGHQGVFLPQIQSDRMALVCEGPTDVCAALTLGFYAIGRPSCSGGVSDIITAFRRLGVASAVIVADNDDVGTRFATMLRQNLPIRSALIVLPAKDLREFVRLGGTRELLDSMIDNLVWEAK